MVDTILGYYIKLSLWAAEAVGRITEVEENKNIWQYNLKLVEVF